MRRRAGTRVQRGAAAVEFALTVTIFLLLVGSAIELAQLMWTWNAAVDATRLGARLAAVCSPGDKHGSPPAGVTQRMQAVLPALRAEQIEVQYLDADGQDTGCAIEGSANVCRLVRVQLVGFTHPLQWLLAPSGAGARGGDPASATAPSFPVTVPREHMDSAGNPACAS